MPASAERDRSAPSQPELLAILIHDREITFHAQWAVAKNCNFCASQRFLRLQNPSSAFESILKITARMEKHKRLQNEFAPRIRSYNSFPDCLSGGRSFSSDIWSLNERGFSP